MIECKTHRYYGHHQGDNTLRCRTEAERQHARTRDPLVILREHARADGVLISSELDEIDARSRAALDEAVSFAESSPLPEPRDLYTHVYVE